MDVSETPPQKKGESNGYQTLYLLSVENSIH